MQIRVYSHHSRNSPLTANAEEQESRYIYSRNSPLTANAEEQESILISQATSQNFLSIALFQISNISTLLQGAES